MYNLIRKDQNKKFCGVKKLNVVSIMKRRK